MVDIPPKFMEKMSSQTVQEGVTVTFTCGVEETDDMKYKWLFNGRPLAIAYGSRRSIDGQKLTIKSVNTADIGNYACNATNSVGHAFGQAVLNVICKFFVFSRNANDRY